MHLSNRGLFIHWMLYSDFPKDHYFLRVTPRSGSDSRAFNFENFFYQDLASISSKEILSC